MAFSGEVYATGHTRAHGSDDMVLFKSDSSCNQVWNRTYVDSVSSEIAYDAFVDHNSDIYICGKLLFSSQNDFGYIKYNSAGTLLSNAHWGVEGLTRHKLWDFGLSV
ncbi:MAG: hypothetical protein GF383_09740 [Candidatus Lokiarchaeota archaeon]|nr:hypothetical protein [Candidatus Lokiarchaeota archaeon]MBD3340805.1 hypothetical protein [Candidatus Lokiarchaeota archaeon]